MNSTGITRQGACVHISCEKARWAKGLCRRHYESLNRQQWRRGKPALANPLPPKKEKPITGREKRGYDPEDLWEFVKSQLVIKDNKVITFQKADF